MANARAILKRRKAVQNIRKITRTMQLIATARFQKTFNRAVSAKPYTEKISRLASSMARRTDAGHPLVKTPQHVEKIALLIITSNRGLCGGYNSNILHTAEKFIAERNKDNKNVLIDVVGKKGISHLKFLGKTIENAQVLPDEVSYPQAVEIAERYMDLFISEKIDAVAVAYMQFLSTSKQEPTIIQLLPMQMAQDETEQHHYE